MSSNSINVFIFTPPLVATIKTNESLEISSDIKHIYIDDATDGYRIRRTKRRGLLAQGVMIFSRTPMQGFARYMRNKELYVATRVEKELHNTHVARSYTTRA